MALSNPVRNVPAAPAPRRAGAGLGTGAGLTLLCVLALLPVASLVWLALAGAVWGDGTASVWRHLLANVLPRVAGDTGLLLLGVGIGTTLAGAGTAWLVALHDFPGRRALALLLPLPLAVPTYVAAYCWVEWLDHAGPVQTLARDWTGLRLGGVPDVRSLWGGILVFTFVLYPYVHLPCRLLFASQGASQLDAARSLGQSGRGLLMRVGLPLARPAVAGGVALALMETLNDIGAVEALGVRTVTFAVFETWLNRDSLQGAVQLALVAVAVVVALVWLERTGRAGRRYTSARTRPPGRIALSGAGGIGAATACALPVLLGLGIPCAVLLPYAARRLEQFVEPRLLGALWGSVTISTLTSVLCVAVAFGVLEVSRLSRRSGWATAGRLATLGYAIPGTVLAIGVLVPFAAFDNALDGWLERTLGLRSGLLLTGSLAALVYACTLRALAVAWGPIEAGHARLSPRIDMAARTLGRDGTAIAREVHLPVLLPVLGAGGLMVFIDTMKELPATLLLRPFGFETVATLVYDRATQEALEDAAAASLVTILVGLISVAAVSRLARAERR